MSTTVKIRPEQLAAKLLGEAKRIRGGIGRASLSAARHFQALLAHETDEQGITDLGVLKASWRTAKTGTGAVVYSDAPHAGIIELGARPHPVSKEGIEAIARWAVRKLGKSPQDAMSFAHAVAEKIKREGQKPHYLVRDQLPMARKFLAEELARVLRASPAGDSP